MMRLNSAIYRIHKVVTLSASWNPRGDVPCLISDPSSYPSSRVTEKPALSLKIREYKVLIASQNPAFRQRPQYEYQRELFNRGFSTREPVDQSRWSKVTTSLNTSRLRRGCQLSCHPRATPSHHTSFFLSPSPCSDRGYLHGTRLDNGSSRLFCFLPMSSYRVRSAFVISKLLRSGMLFQTTVPCFSLQFGKRL